MFISLCKSEEYGARSTSEDFCCWNFSNCLISGLLNFEACLTDHLFKFYSSFLSPSVKLKEMGEAEEALSEANALNNNNAEVWAYLALVCMQVSAQPARYYSIKCDNVFCFIYNYLHV